jgi:PTS system ascorbate-specific IIA component
MIGLLIISHGSVGKSMVLCAEQILGKKIPNLVCLGVKRHDGLEKTFEEAQDAITLLDQGDGVLVLSDVFGATPCNVAARLAQGGKVEVVSGLSMPMLFRVLNYRHLPLSELVEKALAGGKDGIVRVASSHAKA